MRLMLGFCLMVCGAAASPLTDAIAARDVVRLDGLASEDASGDVARGAALALRHQDRAALALLEPLAQASVAPERRVAACMALADLYLRQMRYADTQAALVCSEQASGRPLTGEPAQIKADAAALAGEKPMTLVRPASGTLELVRDGAGLIRVGVAVNDRALTAVIDTDASFSVVSRSTAARLGLRLLPETLAIVTTSRADQPMQLAVADRLTFGNAEFRDVVFAVLPDAAVRFGPSYRMEAVIGLPVLVALGRIGVDRQQLEYGRGPRPAMAPNLILSGLDPFVLIAVDGQTLRLALDTAADKTVLNAAARVPGGDAGAYSWQGAGGAATDHNSRLLRHWSFTLGPTAVTLTRVPVLSTTEPDRDGLLGLDAVKGARRWTIDFDAMCFWIEP